MRIPVKLDWMTDKDFEGIEIYWGLVCDYDMYWEDKADYEEWCKRVLEK